MVSSPSITPVDTPRALSPTSTIIPTRQPSIVSTPEKHSENPVQTQNASPKSSPRPLSTLSPARKVLLLIFFSIAQFIDICNVSAMFTAIPIISEQLSIPANQSVWLTSAYQLTFASFLLLSGRMSDIYNPKHLFNTGFGALGLISLITGFVKQKVALIVLRAFAGIAAAFTIPSALSLIVHLFPTPTSQARALSLFSGAGAVGNISGQLIGAVFVQLATYHWIFWFNSIIAIPIAVACTFLIPQPPSSSPHSKSQSQSSSQPQSRLSNLKRLDIPGISLLTLSIVLLISSLTSATTDGWGSGTVLGPLIVSIILLFVLFWYETKIPVENAALPPHIWFYPNFSALFGVSLLPYLWWTALFLLFTTFYQDVVHWSPILTAVHFLPIGITAFITFGFIVPYLQQRLSLKLTILSGLILAVPSTILLALANTSSKYWSYAFPAFVVGTLGLAVVYTNISVGMFRATPPSLAGIVGAIYNSALQLGAAVGVAVITTIETNVEDKHVDGSMGFEGRAAGFWFLFAVLCVEVVAAFFFFHEGVQPGVDSDSGVDSDVRGVGEKNGDEEEDVRTRCENDSSENSFTQDMDDVRTIGV